MKRKLIASALILSIVCSVGSCGQVAETEDTSVEIPTTTTVPTRYCGICGNPFRSDRERDADDWVSIGTYGMCTSCRDYYESAALEMNRYEAAMALEAGLQSVDYDQSDYDVKAIFVNDHIVELVNVGEDPWEFNGAPTLLIKYGEKWWVIEPLEETELDDTVHVLEPQSSIYLEYDLSVYGELNNGIYKLVYGDLSYGSRYYGANFNLRWDGMIYDMIRSSVDPDYDRLMCVYEAFRYLKETDEYIQATDDEKLEMTYDLISVLATDGFYGYQYGLAPSAGSDYSYPIIDIDTVELVDNTYYCDTIDGFTAVLEVV